MISACTVWCICRLIEAEERYRSREARPQDIELIEKLKRIISEQELKLKELTVRFTHVYFIPLILYVHLGRKEVI